MSVFEITDSNSGNIIVRVEAPNRRAALAYGRQLIEARELSSKEIVDAVQAGLGITDILAEDEQAREDATMDRAEAEA